MAWKIKSKSRVLAHLSCPLEIEYSLGHELGIIDEFVVGLSKQHYEKYFTSVAEISLRFSFHYWSSDAVHRRITYYSFDDNHLLGQTDLMLGRAWPLSDPNILKIVNGHFRSLGYERPWASESIDECAKELERLYGTVDANS